MTKFMKSFNDAISDFDWATEEFETASKPLKMQYGSIYRDH